MRSGTSGGRLLWHKLQNNVKINCRWLKRSGTLSLSLLSPTADAGYGEKGSEDETLPLELRFMGKYEEAGRTVFHMYEKTRVSFCARFAEIQSRRGRAATRSALPEETCPLSMTHP